MEETFVVSLTESQMNALGQFLGRVNLNAKEVPTWNALTQALNQAQPVEAAGSDDAE